ncbi:Imm1 family immunity protein [Saccharothrix lopnurensis]|uniref:Imm1 family immunity protein n=1 Tax=Saccharothrix lopnurensis TaxID=1670621 RepID=A0ABW1P7Z3_9PSEU
MAHTLNVYYEKQHTADPVVVTTPEDIRDLFAAVRAKYPAGTALLMTVVPADYPWASELTVGIDGDKGVLRYAGQDSPPTGCFSKSAEPSNTEPVIYYFVTADNEFPPCAEIPVTDLETALIDYMTTGQRPETIEWQTIR